MTSATGSTYQHRYPNGAIASPPGLMKIASWKLERRMRMKIQVSIQSLCVLHNIQTIINNHLINLHIKYFIHNVPSFITVNLRIFPGSSKYLQ